MTFFALSWEGIYSDQRIIQVKKKEYMSIIYKVYVEV